jgi:small subunit ribosomal protein S20
LANSAQSLKRAKQAEVRRKRNQGPRTYFRTCIKRVFEAIDAGDKPAAESAYKVAESVIDKMVNKGIIHQNKADRHKSRINKHIKGLSAA